MIFIVTLLALIPAHRVGDYWLQTHGQALTKGAPGLRGRVACGEHVLTLTGVKVLFLLLAYAATGIWPALYAAVIGLGLDAVSHYWADRAAGHPDKHKPVTLERLAIATGKEDFWSFGKGAVDAAGNPVGTASAGSNLLDQSFHMGMLFVAALVMELLTF
jgi:hypothetical protein